VTTKKEKAKYQPSYLLYQRGGILGGKIVDAKLDNQRTESEPTVPIINNNLTQKHFYFKIKIKLFLKKFLTAGILL